MDVQLRLFPSEPDPPRPPGVGPAAPTDEVVRMASRLPGSVRLGTSSWSFPGWEGLVYDRPASEDVLAREGLAAYGAHPLFGTVGLDRTFYRPVSTATFREYASQVPDDFRFVVKADRLLTSPLDPQAYMARSRNPRYLDPAYAAAEVVGPMMEGLGHKAGALLFQFPPIPPNLVGGRAAFLRRLERFLAALPEGPLYSVELRTPAFLTDAYAATLDGLGVAHCFNVHPSMPPLERQLQVVQPFYQPALVLRWMLHSGLKYEAARERYAPFDRLVDEDTASRHRIATTVIDVTLAERPSFVIVNNKAEGSAPLSLFHLARHICEWTPTGAV